jgi:hypothetical protein
MHVYNPRYSGGGGRRIVVQSQAQQKWETLCDRQTKIKDWVCVAWVVENLLIKFKSPLAKKNLNK